MYGYITDDVKQKFHAENIFSVFISRGLIIVLQSLDITVNKIFKTKLRLICESLVTLGEHSFTKTGRMQCERLTGVAERTLQAWKGFSSSCIKNGFRKTEIVSSLF